MASYRRIEGEIFSLPAESQCMTADRQVTESRDGFTFFRLRLSHAGGRQICNRQEICLSKT